MKKIKIIAEVGVNHNGRISLAKKLIKQAKKILNLRKSEISIKKNPYYGINVTKKIYLKLKNLDLNKKNYKIFYDIKI